MVNQRISLKDVQVSVGKKIIGGAEELTATVAADNEEAYEAANYFPVEIIDGKKHISGTLTRAFIDVQTLNDLFPADAGLWGSYTITGTVVSGKTPGRTITITGAKFDSFDINSLSLEGYAKNSLPFKALNWKLSA